MRYQACFQRDRDRILHSKAFRRLKNKTQVFLTPKGDHYRTRMSHTLEVSQNARTIAKALRLNEDLVEASSTGTRAWGIHRLDMRVSASSMRFTRVALSIMSRVCA